MTASSVPNGTAQRIALSGPGWHTVQLDNGERIQVAALNPPWDVPEWIEWPIDKATGTSGHKRQIVKVEENAK